ncbi:MAG: hypothetical protein RL757_2008, partial [Bacteroidota bacterium]
MKKTLLLGSVALLLLFTFGC